MQLLISPVVDGKINDGEVVNDVVTSASGDNVISALPSSISVFLYGVPLAEYRQLRRHGYQTITSRQCLLINYNENDNQILQNDNKK